MGSFGSSGGTRSFSPVVKGGRQKTRPFQGGFLTHTLAKNTLNNQKSGFREAHGAERLGDLHDPGMEGGQIQGDGNPLGGLDAERVQAFRDVLLGGGVALALDHVGGKNDEVGAGLALSGTSAGGEHREKDEREEGNLFHEKRFVALHTRKRCAKLQATG